MSSSDRVIHEYPIDITPRSPIQFDKTKDVVFIRVKGNVTIGCSDEGNSITCKDLIIYVKKNTKLRLLGSVELEEGYGLMLNRCKEYYSDSSIFSNGVEILRNPRNENILSVYRKHNLVNYTIVDLETSESFIKSWISIRLEHERMEHSKCTMFLAINAICMSVNGMYLSRLLAGEIQYGSISLCQHIIDVKFILIVGIILATIMLLLSSIQIIRTLRSSSRRRYVDPTSYDSTEYYLVGHNYTDKSLEYARKRVEDLLDIYENVNIRLRNIQECTNKVPWYTSIGFLLVAIVICISAITGGAII